MKTQTKCITNLFLVFVVFGTFSPMRSGRKTRQGNRLFRPPSAAPGSTCRDVPRRCTLARRKLWYRFRGRV